VYFATREDDLIKNLVQGFADPIYPLSLRRDDEMIRLESIKVTYLRPAKPPIIVERTMVPYEVSKDLSPDSKVRMVSSSKIYVCPRSFTINKKVRTGVDHKRYIYTPKSLTIVNPIEAYIDEDERNVIFL
jgi:hypothetical protein